MIPFWSQTAHFVVALFGQFLPGERSPASSKVSGSGLRSHRIFASDLISSFESIGSRTGESWVCASGSVCGYEVSDAIFKEAGNAI